MTFLNCLFKLIFFFYKYIRKHQRENILNYDNNYDKQHKKGKLVRNIENKTTDLNDVRKNCRKLNVKRNTQ